MIIALLVVICIMALDLRNLANKVKESNKYYLKCIKLMNDMDITLLDKINDREEDIERLKNEGKLIEQQLETIIELKKIGNDLDKLDNVIKADKTKATAITKSCSIDGKCNYMDKFTTVK